MKKDKTIAVIELRGHKMFMIVNQYGCPKMEVEVTPVWNFCKHVVLNMWSLERFKEEKKNRVLPEDFI